VEIGNGLKEAFF